MKNVIIVAKNGGENKEMLAMKNIDITAMVEVVKVLDAIDLRSKHNQAISNADIDATRDLRLIGIKKYQRHASQI